jgi:hypothetical protein
MALTPFQFGQFVKQAIGPAPYQPGGIPAEDTPQLQNFRQGLAGQAPSMPAPAPVSVPPLAAQEIGPAPSNPLVPDFGGMTQKQLVGNVHPRTGGTGTRPLGPEGLTSGALPFGPGAKPAGKQQPAPARPYQYAKRTTSL